MMEKLKSRKFWAAVFGALTPVITEVITGSVGWENALMMTAGVLSAYIFGQAYVDGAEKASLPKS